MYLSYIINTICYYVILCYSKIPPININYCITNYNNSQLILQNDIILYYKI